MLKQPPLHDLRSVYQVRRMTEEEGEMWMSQMGLVGRCQEGTPFRVVGMQVVDVDRYLIPWWVSIEGRLLLISGLLCFPQLVEPMTRNQGQGFLLR